MTDSRIEMIDFLRGLVIIDMMLVHYSGYLNVIPGISLSKLINYSDFAMEGFTLLAGFMVGYHYFPIFLENKVKPIRRLLYRFLQILAIYYMFVLTISLPLAIFTGAAETGSDTLLTYIGKSLLFVNQVWLLHILPTFIPLFLIAIPVLFLLERVNNFFVLMGSILFFIIGNYNPYLFTVGDKTIFPAILWQIYFIIGVILGKRSYENNKIIPNHVFLHLVFASVVFIAAAFIYHGHHIFPGMSGLKYYYNVTVSKFPLNYLGFLYYGSIFYILYCVTVLVWKFISRQKMIFGPVMLFGRHSLLTFVIHVYFAKLLGMTSYFTGNPSPLPLVIIAMNLLVTFFILKYFEERKMNESLSVERELKTQKVVS